MQKALIVVSSYFPTGVAISSRMLNFGRLLRDAGWGVHVITGYHVDSSVEIGKKYEIEGITYQVASKRKPSGLNTFIGDYTLVNTIKDYLDMNKVDCVFMNAACENFSKIKCLCKKHQNRLFVEQCEWLDLSNYKFGKFDIRYINTQRLRKNGFSGSSGIVSISRLLNEHYEKVGVRTIRVPTILDVKNTFSEITANRNDNKIHIVFAGSLGGSKELMKPIIEALAEHVELRDTIIFDIYGPTEKQIITNIGDNTEMLNSAGKSVVIHGRIPQEQIPGVYLNSDYLIFVRPQRKSSNAGFPTKFAESMAVGTPVITNNTGDIGLYLKNGENGFLLPDNTTEAVCECFRRMIKISDEEYTQMRKAARETAEKSFDYRVYMEEVSNFFSTII